MTMANEGRDSGTKPTRVALLGAGYILQAHARSLAHLPGVQTTAVCDLALERARDAAAAYGIPDAFGSLDDMLAADVCDAVHVLLPPSAHFSAARRILESGRSVFLEKPMAPDVADCEALVEIAGSRGLKLGVNHNFLFLSGYEALRRDVRSGRLGPLDHVVGEWLYELGLLQSGPFRNWMLEAEGNLVFELAPHLAAFVIDLVGLPESLTAVASHPLDIPGAQRVWRHWDAAGQHGRTSLALHLSLTPGQPVRRVQVRGLGGAAQLDFERNVYLREQTVSNSAVFGPLFDALSQASSATGQALRNFAIAVRGTLRKAPQSNVFLQSIHRSIAAFHAPGDLDERLQGRFGVQVMRLCDRIVASSGVSRRRAAASPADAMPRPAARPTVLVVGGTGFIGRRLVAALAQRGYGVRVLSRSAEAARAMLGDMPVEVVQGSHDEPAALARALDGIEVVYHLAKAEGKRWDDYVRHDIEPTRRLAEAALTHGVRRFIYTGTIDSYASADARDVIDGSTPVDAQIESRNHYARSKAACEALLLELHRTRGLPVVVLRPGVVIGTGSPPAHWGVGMFHSPTRVQFWGDGRAPVPFVLVDDVADALVRAMLVPDIEGRAFLVTDAPLLSARDYVHEVERASGLRIDARPTPIWRFFALDVLKEAAKHAIRHPNRRRPSYRDWACRSHRARYDNRQTREVLGWAPAGTREAVVSHGIDAAVRYHQR
ncbi:MAG TPA: NAD-dependent epimerase/dehydratase family protein [Caldimonas sp.]|nr:NAD-dependent epimerase/dehydratase family protein [Caldimonas sp.]